MPEKLKEHKTMAKEVGRKLGLYAIIEAKEQEYFEEERRVKSQQLC